jgi:hypothetical protein
MKTAKERMWERMRTPRVMTSISLRIPESVIESLKEIAPTLGFSGYQGLIKAYISQGLRKDLERLEGSQVQALTESLREKGISAETIAEAILEAGMQTIATFETELRHAIERKDRAAICTMIESIPTDRWSVSEGMAIATHERAQIVVHHVSGGTGIDTYEKVAVLVNWPSGQHQSLGGFTSNELRLPNYISLEERETARKKIAMSTSA